MKTMKCAALCLAALLSGSAAEFPVMTESTVIAYEEASGTLENGVRWALQGETLTITGTGELPERWEVLPSADGTVQWNGSTPPWAQYANDIRTLEIEDGIMLISSGAFAGLTNLREVTLPENLRAIAPYAFYGAGNLQSLQLPDSVTYIGNNAFGNCGFTSITLPSSLDTISGHAFDGTGITALRLPPSLMDITDDACFGECPELQSIVLPEGSAVFRMEGNALYSSNGEKLFRALGTYGDSYTVPDTVTCIGADAFRNTSYREYQLPAGISYIGENAFAGVNTGAVITFAGTVEQWGAITVMAGNEALSTMTITCTGSIVQPSTPADEGFSPIDPDHSENWWKVENGVLTIRGTGRMCDPLPKDDYPWASCQETVTSVIIEEGITTVSENAFEDFQLDAISLPTTLERIEANAFNAAFCVSDVKTLDFSGMPNLTYIDEYAFFMATEVETLILPDSLTYLAPTAFQATKIKTVHIPAGVGMELVTEHRAFPQCRELEAFTVDPANPYFSTVDGVLTDKTGKIIYSWPEGTIDNYLVIPDKFTTIAPYGFFMMDTVYGIYVPDTITSIGDHAFAVSEPLYYLRLPSDLEVIPFALCYKCTDLTTIVLPDCPAQIEGYAFDALGDMPHLYTAGPAESWAGLAATSADWMDEEAAISYSSSPDVCLSADLNADAAVDATDAAFLLQYAAARGSGEATDAALYFIEKGMFFPTVEQNFNVIEDRYGDPSVDGAWPADVNRSNECNAADAAVMLQYASAAGTGFAGGLAAYIQATP